MMSKFNLFLDGDSHKQLEIPLFIPKSSSSTKAERLNSSRIFLISTSFLFGAFFLSSCSTPKDIKDKRSTTPQIDIWTKGNCKQAQLRQYKREIIWCKQNGYL